MKRIILALIASACMAATAGAQTVYSCDYRSDADLVIYFTSYKSDAGWRNKSKQHLMF